MCVCVCERESLQITGPSSCPAAQSSQASLIDWRRKKKSPRLNVLHVKDLVENRAAESMA